MAETTIVGVVGGAGAIPGPIVAAGGAVLSAAARALINSFTASPKKSAFQVGSDIEIVAGGAANQINGCPPADLRFKIDPCSGELVPVKRRRRRRRLLSCSDKVDISFVTGTLGKGQLAGTAISSLLARCA